MAHGLPQPPQFATSFCVSTQVVPQQVCPPVQLQGSGTQMPVRQICPAGHAAPQAPQCRASWVVSTQPEPGQQLMPPEHAGESSHWHAPATHALAKPATQPLPHPPQFAGSVSRSTQRRSQQVVPAVHAPAVPQRPDSGCEASSSTTWVAAQPATSTTAAAHPPKPGCPRPTDRRITHLPRQPADTQES